MSLRAFAFLCFTFWIISSTGRVRLRKKERKGTWCVHIFCVPNELFKRTTVFNDFEAGVPCTKESRENSARFSKCMSHCCVNNNQK